MGRDADGKIEIPVVPWSVLKYSETKVKKKKHVDGFSEEAEADYLYCELKRSSVMAYANKIKHAFRMTHGEKVKDLHWSVFIPDGPRKQEMEFLRASRKKFE